MSFGINGPRGINGIIYVHQLRIWHFLQGIWLIGHDHSHFRGIQRFQAQPRSSWEPDHQNIFYCICIRMCTHLHKRVYPNT